MRVLVAGANGFIGSRVTAALRAAGHDVTAAVRKADAPGTVACDFSRDIDAAIWKPRLAGIDAVVNCAGILRETRHDTFQSVHIDAPLALFRACAETGVRRVIQISALGEPEDGEFIASKHRSDTALADLDLDWLVLRPGLVYSAYGAYGGTALLRALAALPGVLPLPRDGAQPIRPIAAEDLAAAIAVALANPHLRREVIELVGPEVLTLRDYLLAWRRWFGLSRALIFPTPSWLTAATIAIGEVWGRGPLCRVIGNLLQRRRIGAADAIARTHALLGRAPMTLTQALTERPSDARDFWQARWYVARPLLLASIALVWIGSGLVGLMLPDSSAHAALPGWTPGVVRATTLIASTVDLALGMMLALGLRVRLVLTLMLAMVVAYTVVIGIAFPAHWLDPFGSLLKNLALAALLAALLMLEPRR